MALLQTNNMNPEDDNTPSGLVQPSQGQLVVGNQQPAQSIRDTSQQFMSSSAGGAEAPVVSGPTGTMAAGGGGAIDRTQQTTTPNRASTGGVTDFQRILAANQEQAQGLAQNVGSQVQGEVQGNLDAARSAALTRFAGRADQPDVDTSLVNQVASNPVSVLQDPNLSAAFRTILGGQYAGPTELGAESTSQLSRAATEATEAAERLRTPGGIEETFARLGEGRRQAPGRDAFDTALLQGVPGAREYLQTVSESLAPMGEQTMSTARQSAADIVAQQQKEAAEAATSTRGRFEQTVLPQFQSRIESSAAAAQKAAQDRASALQSAVASERDLTPQQLADLGVTAEQYNALRADPNLQLQNYYATSPGQITAQQAATPEDYAYYQALQNLLGGEASFLSDAAVSGTGNADFSDYALDEAMKGKRALEVQRLGYNDADAAYLTRSDIGGRYKSPQWSDAESRTMQKLIVERNLPTTTDFVTVVSDDRKTQRDLAAQGFVKGFQMAKDNTDREYWYKPEALTSFDRLYDPTTGEFIEAGNIPLPVLAQLLGQTGGAGGQAPSTVSRPTGGQVYAGGSPTFDYTGGQTGSLPVGTPSIEDILANVSGGYVQTPSLRPQDIWAAQQQEQTLPQELDNETIAAILESMRDGQGSRNIR